MSKRLYGKYICTNCFQDGDPVFNKHVCPACKSKGLIPTSTPRGHDLIVARYGAGVIEQKNIASSAQRKLANLNGVLVVLIFLSLFYLSAPKRDHQTSVVDNQISAADDLIETRKVDASVLCRNRMESRLKAPSTAQFPWTADHTGYLEFGDDNVMITVHSYVDAQNGFGAMIRTNYICNVEYKGDDSQNGIILTLSEK